MFEFFKGKAKVAPPQEDLPNGTPFSFNPVGKELNPMSYLQEQDDEAYGLDCPQGKVQNCCGNKPCDQGEYRAVDAKVTVTESEERTSEQTKLSIARTQGFCEGLSSKEPVPRHPVEVAISVLDLYAKTISEDMEWEEGCMFLDLVDISVEVLKKDLEEYMKGE